MATGQDVIELLVEDHRAMHQLLDRLDEENEPAALRQVFLELVEMLAAHEAIEQELLFPALAGDLHDCGDQLGEHEEINQLLDEMQGLRIAGFGFLKRASSVVVQLRDHFAEEEAEVFPRLRACVTDAERAVLGERALEIRRRTRAFRQAVPTA